jgi:flagellar motility protein MotE (MotC chaperone)
MQFAEKLTTSSIPQENSVNKPDTPPQQPAIVTNAFDTQETPTETFKNKELSETDKNIHEINERIRHTLHAFNSELSTLNIFGLHEINEATNQYKERTSRKIATQLQKLEEYRQDILQNLRLASSIKEAINPYIAIEAINEIKTVKNTLRQIQKTNPEIYRAGLDKFTIHDLEILIENGTEFMEAKELADQLELLDHEINARISLYLEKTSLDIDSLLGNLSETKAKYDYIKILLDQANFINRKIAGLLKKAETVNPKASTGLKVVVNNHLQSILEAVNDLNFYTNPQQQIKN